MLDLRDYQEDSSYSIRRCLALYRKVLFYLGTGGGKTAIACDVIIRAVKSGKRCIFLVDRDTLLNQSYNAFKEAGLNVERLESTTKTIWKTDVYVCMAETFYRRKSRGWFMNIPIDLIIVDEAHVGVFEKSIDLFPDSYILGLSATPVSSNGKPLNKTYNKLIIGETISNLQKNGYLLPSNDIGHNDMLDLMKMAGEFTSASQILQFQQKNIDDRMVRLWQQHSKNDQTIIFNINVEHNNSVVERFKKLGVNVAGVDAKTPGRNKIDEDFKDGKIQVLCNVGIHTKGSDFPCIGTVVANYSTNSIAKYFQTVGRGARPFPGMSHFTTIDMGNNFLRYGSYNDDVDWLSIFENEKLDKDRKPNKTIRLCPNCYAYLVNPHVPICPVCTTNLIGKTLLKLEDEMPSHLVDKDISNIRDWPLNDIRDYAKFKGYKNPNGWAFCTKFNKFKR